MLATVLRLLATTPEQPAKAGLTAAQQVIALVLAIGMLAVVIELVRKRKLREEYSVLWTTTSLALIALAADIRLLHWLMDLLGAEQGMSVLFFGGLLFLLAVALQFSVRLSKLTFRNKALTQRVALLEQQLRALEGPRQEGDRKRRTSRGDVA